MLHKDQCILARSMLVFVFYKKQMKQINSWTVIKEDLNIKYCLRKPLCRCVCGKEKNVWQTALNIGKSQSCGCIFRVVSAARIRERNLKHGLSRNAVNKGHDLYPVWIGMKRRCANSSLKGYHNYGGRGITVCEEWKSDFLLFLNWSTSNGYKKGLQIDRIDNDGNYSPKNCRWVTCHVNSRNKRSNRKINGQCISDLSLAISESNNLINERLKAGWSLEKSLNKPKRPYTYRVRIKRVPSTKKAK